MNHQTVRAKSHKMSKHLKVHKKVISSPRRNLSKPKSCHQKLERVCKSVQNLPIWNKRKKRKKGNRKQQKGNRKKTLEKKEKEKRRKRRKLVESTISQRKER